MTAQPRWYEGIPDILADESEFMVGLCEYNHILMEQALSTVCCRCGGSGLEPTDAPTIDHAHLDEWLDVQAAREPAWNDHTEG